MGALLVALVCVAGCASAPRPPQDQPLRLELHLPDRVVLGKTAVLTKTIQNISGSRVSAIIHEGGYNFVSSGAALGRGRCFDRTQPCVPEDGRLTLEPQQVASWRVALRVPAGLGPGRLLINHFVEVECHGTPCTPGWLTSSMAATTAAVDAE